ncbi:ADP-ribosylglycohydrolase family protein [Parasphingorhabdus sp.]|uniref:ADP-ribosylglycohydrolase family protein n=1 Tax=Parasphingorhabdus sp. TaxID=2709688 RepID=UPI002F91F574
MTEAPHTPFPVSEIPASRSARLRPGTVVDRARGCLLGLAVGDAIGTTVEFSPRGSFEPLTDMVGGGPFGLEAGQWTDDTSMALSLADSLLASTAFDPTNLMQNFVGWFRDGEYSATGKCFDIGHTTETALRLFEQSGEPFAGSRDPGDAGNGSLMRLAPVAIWGASRDDDLMRETARLQSATTHGATTCLDACEAYAVMMKSVILGANFPAALLLASDIPLGDTIGQIIGGSFHRKPIQDIQSSGYVAHSLEAALWCVDSGGDFADMVLRAANLGDDADTTAAITGQLAGALFGETGIPEDWLEKLAWRGIIGDMAEALLHR